jgi:PAS domain S-box-containing protein
MTLTAFFSILYPVSAIITFLLILFGWVNRKNPVSNPFILLMTATTIWTMGDALITLTPDPALDYLITGTIYPGVVTVPVAWFLVILSYTGYDHDLNLKKISLLFAIPALSVVLVITNPGHLLFYTSVIPEVLDSFVIWHYTHGPLFLLSIIYSYSLIFFSFVLIVSRLLSPTDIYRRQTYVLFIASFIPFACNVLYVFNPEPGPAIDLTPFSFTLVGLFIFIGIIRYQLFSTVPLAYSSLFASMHDAVIATDSSYRIIDLNPAAIRLCRCQSKKALGVRVNMVLPEISLPEENNRLAQEHRNEMMMMSEGTVRFYEVTDFPLISEKKGEGWIFTFRDISERRQIQESLERANKNLNLLSSITRHDILNLVTGLQGYLTFSMEENTNENIGGYLTKCQELTRTIQHQIEFTRFYQEIGAGKPRWQNIAWLAAKIRREFPPAPADYRVELDGVQVYADPLLEKVFFTLVENTIRHGEGASALSFTFQVVDGSLVLTYQDNGPGIIEEDKSKIFQKQFGKHTGYGLFIAREILTITGMTILEDGNFGDGARFRISVPPGAWKILPP